MEMPSTLHFSLTPPSGHYDYFQVKLNAPEQTPTESRSWRQVAVQNFTHTQTSVDVTFGNIQPGETYELWSETFRSVSSSPAVRTEGKLAKLLDALVLVNPVEVTDVKVFVLSDTEVSVAWKKPTTGVYEDFRVYLYKASEPNATVMHPIQTLNTKVTLSELSRDAVYLVSVVSCATLAIHCDKASEPVSAVFGFAAQPIQSVNVLSIGSTEDNADRVTNLVKNSSSLLVEVTVNATAVNLCDLSRFYLEYLGL